MTTHHGSELEHRPATGDPIPDPGLKPAQPRLTDVDERMARRAEVQVAALFGLATLCMLAFCVAYFVFQLDDDVSSTRASNYALGGLLGLALTLVGIGAVQWAKKLMVDQEVVQERHPMRSERETTQETVEKFELGTQESGFGRRTLIRNSLLGAMATLPLPAVVLLRDLGPLPGNDKAHTGWQAGERVVNDETFTPLRPEDLSVGQLVNAMPAGYEELDEHGPDRQVSKSKDPIILVRMNPDEIVAVGGRENWSVEGILAYSKICTHAGCPISLYEQNTHHLLCPCHQSTFDLAEGGKVVFGPAARSLPQLPLRVDNEGYLVAQSDFTEPVGPSYWERG